MDKILPYVIAGVVVWWLTMRPAAPFNEDEPDFGALRDPSASGFPGFAAQPIDSSGSLITPNSIYTPPSPPPIDRQALRDERRARSQAHHEQRRQQRQQERIGQSRNRGGNRMA